MYSEQTSTSMLVVGAAFHTSWQVPPLLVRLNPFVPFPALLGL